jgi:hypothetical protein
MKKSLFAALFVALSVCTQGQEKRPPTQLEDLNVEFMMRGYFFAGSRIQDKQALGGFGASRNNPKAIASDRAVSDGTISLIAKPDEEAIFAEKYKGLMVLLVNGTNRRIGFPASDSRLYIVQEALDMDGKWKPVEYLPSSWCGNSYHTVFLGPKEYWEFAAARYNGKFKTRLRFRLDWQKSQREKLTIYSNEFEGNINAKQFTVQQGHKPTSVMDPYNN